MKKIIILCLLSLGITGCISAPKGLEREQFQIQDIQEIQNDDYLCQCKKARLAGKVLNAIALKDKMKIEILSYPVSRFSAKPAIYSVPNGRFIAYINGFVDPEILKDQYMSFSGVLVKTEQGKIDQANYLYPVLKVDNYKRWKLVEEYYYDPEDLADYREQRLRWGFGAFWRPEPKLRWNLY
ncbi:outer membrane lipoprotein [Bisgaardia hudsonensis]|uniref:Outer membrane lipoprotein n=1 Tax=Bisgaardia hudsonensis TaxID=109472 RepID=A0A4R2N167_9PAST|nr:Slp family lipoprotein [Bisgaardia hudsonensis]QLB13170.1 hypothetical protein A6A11_05855 [Bisgaardia hudsonensis]TCP13256.1 outer membrane lipoprotein [Bisgaardia hudsonensis]